MKFLLIYYVVLNILAFVFFGIDKYKAKIKSYRLSEDSLLLVAALGGAVGASMGMNFFYHKTQHKKFTIGVPLLVVLNTMIYYFIGNLLI